MKITLLLHAGRHKTGSTSLQEVFTLNREKLLECGILYPSTGNYKYAHHSFANCIKGAFLSASGQQELENLLDKLNNEIKNKKITTVLLSSEAFQNISPNILKEAFPGFIVKPIFYVRNKLDYFISSYAQKVHAKDYYGTLEDYWISNFSRLNYKKFFSKWESVFRDNLFIKIYDRKSLIKGDISEDFFSSFLMNVDDWKRIDVERNPSLKLELLSYKLALNKLYPSHASTQKTYAKFNNIAGLNMNWTSIPISEEIFSGFASTLEEENDFLTKITNKEVRFNYELYPNKGYSEDLHLSVEELLNDLDLDINHQKLYEASLEILKDWPKFSLPNSQVNICNQHCLSIVCAVDCKFIKETKDLLEEKIFLPEPNLAEISEDTRHLHSAEILVNNSVSLLSKVNILLPSGVISDKNSILKETLWMSKFHRSSNVIRSKNEFYVSHSSLATDRHFDSRVAFIYSNISTNYYHWHFEILAKAWALLSSYKDDDYDYIYAGEFVKNSFKYQSLLLLGFPEGKILYNMNKSFSANEVIYPVLRSKINIPILQGLGSSGGTHYKGWSYDFCCNFPKFLIAKVDCKINLGKKIFVNRIHNKKRNIINISEVRVLLQKAGYIEIDPADYSFQDQVAIFSHAENVVGIHGAGLTNCLYSTNLLSLVELIPRNYLEVSYRILAQIKGAKYLQIACEQPIIINKKKKNDDIDVPLDLLTKAVAMCH